MHSRHIFFYLLSCVLLAIIIFVPRFGWQVHTWLSPAVSQSNTEGLSAENLALKAQLAQYVAIADELPSVPENYIPAVVYSRYPTDFRNQLLVNAGTKEGIAVGHPVVIPAGASSSYILVGKVIAVFPDTAVVQTVFDPGFRMPVRIGAKGYDALFAGGAEPQAVSILKTAAIQAGDPVIAADPSLPYGLPVASVVSADLTPDGFFEEASLQFPYDINTVQAVMVGR